MPRYKIPKIAGQFRIVIALAGNYAVVNDKTGRNKVLIACRDKQHAQALCDLLNSKDRPAELWM